MTRRATGIAMAALGVHGTVVHGGGKPVAEGVGIGGAEVVLAPEPVK